MRQDFKQIIYYATKAPSGHNTQPWKFQIEDDAIIIQPDCSRSLPIVDPDNHALFISLGCALENLLIAASYFGYQPNAQLCTGENPFIRVVMKEAEGIEKNNLFRKSRYAKPPAISTTVNPFRKNIYACCWKQPGRRIPAA